MYAVVSHCAPRAPKVRLPVNVWPRTARSAAGREPSQDRCNMAVGDSSSAARATLGRNALGVAGRGLVPAAREGLGYGGVVAVTVTPCRTVGEVDPSAMQRLCEILSSRGCDGVFVAASTGELILLDEDQRRQLTSAAREGVASRSLVYAGVSGLGLKQTVRFARNAASDGADVAVVMAPFFLRFNQRETLAYLRAVADASPIPLALYHHPRMATPLEVDTVAQSAEHENIVAMKDTSPAVDRIAALAAATAHLDFPVMQGSEISLAESLAAGARGMATALAGVAPEWHVDLFHAARTSNAATVALSQRRIAELWEMFRFEQTGESISAFSASLKLALRRRGWLDSLAGMMPGFAVDAEFEQRIHQHLDAVGLPSDTGVSHRIDPPSGIRT